MSISLLATNPSTRIPPSPARPGRYWAWERKKEMASPSYRTSRHAPQELEVCTGLDLGELYQRLEKLEKGGSTETEGFLGYGIECSGQGPGGWGSHTWLLEACREW